MLCCDRPLVHQPLYRLLLALGLGVVTLMAPGSSFAQGPPPLPDSPYLRPSNRCPSDLQGLTTGLLKDLPSYANRVASRNLRLPVEEPSVAPPNIVVIAGLPDFTPIELSDYSPAHTEADAVTNGDADSDAATRADSPLQQVFFTTLERQYWRNQVVSLQNYHWLFLVQNEDGWYMALLYSSLGRYGAGAGPLASVAGQRPPTPPEESSDGIIGQAIRLWLRDCRAGAVFPVDIEDPVVSPDNAVPSDTVPLDEARP